MCHVTCVCIQMEEALEQTVQLRVMSLNFLFVVSSEAKGSFSTPKNDWRPVIWAVCSSTSSIWSQTHATWHKIFYFKHTLCMRTTSLSSWKAHYSTSSRSCLYYSKINHEYIWPRPNSHYMHFSQPIFFIVSHDSLTLILGCHNNYVALKMPWCCH